MNSPQTLHLAAKASEVSKVFQNVPDAANQPRYGTGIKRQALFEFSNKLWPDPGAEASPFPSAGQRLCARVKSALLAFRRITAYVGRCV